MGGLAAADEKNCGGHSTGHGSRAKAVAAGLGAFFGKLPSALGDTLWAEQRQWALWLPVGFGLGLAGYFAAPVEPSPWLALGVAGILAAGLTVLVRSGRPAVLAIGLLMILTVMAAGFAAGSLRSAHVAAPMIEKRTGTVDLVGTVARVEHRARGDLRVLIDVASLGRFAPEDRPRRVRITMRAGGAGLLPGQTIRVRAILMPPPAPAAPNAYDFARTAWFQGLGGVGFALGAPDIMDGAAGGHALARMRQRVTDRIRAALDERSGAFAAAVTTGDRAGIAETDWRALRDAGLAHLLAISGLHMSAIAALIFVVVRAGLALIEGIALTYPVKKWAALATMVGALSYLLLSGASVSTQRAFIMVLIAMAAILFDRPALALRTVAVAACAVLLWRPESLVHAGFQMSFAAVTALIATYEALRHWRAPWLAPDWGIFSRIGRMLAGVALTTLVAGLATAPFAAFHFQRWGHFDLIANLAAVPLFSLGVMPMVLATLAALPFGLEAWPLWAMGWMIKATLFVAHTVSGWPGSVSLVPAFPTIALGAVVMGGLWIALWTSRWRFWGLAPIALGLIFVLMARPPDLLVARTGKLAALRDRHGHLVLSSGATERFSAEAWLRRDGDGRSVGEAAHRLDADDMAWPERAEGAWVCDDLGCSAQAATGVRIAFAASAEAHGHDCQQADLLISQVPVRGDCSGPSLVIDRFDVWREGAHAVWLSDEGISRVLTARSARGERPWVLPPGPFLTNSSASGER